MQIFFPLFSSIHSRYDTDIQDFRGNSALHIAMGRGQLYNVVVYEVKFLRKHKHYTLKFVKSLCENGCNINVSNNLKRQTPLHLAAKYNMYSCIEVLVEYGANINQQDFEGKTPLMLAIEHGCLEGFACLLCFSPNLRIRTLEQKTALHFAAHVNTFLPQFREFTVQKLLQHGADPNAQDINGDTPLHIVARMNGSTEIIVRLLRHEADPTLLNKRGVSPFYEYMCNERVLPFTNIQTEAQLLPLLTENIFKAFRAFDMCLPRYRPCTIRDPDNRLPQILHIPFKPFIRLVEFFGTNNPESLQTQCIRRIRKYVGIRNIVDNSVTMWKLGLPKLLQEFVGGELFRQALKIPVPNQLNIN